MPACTPAGNHPWLSKTGRTSSEDEANWALLNPPSQQHEAHGFPSCECPSSRSRSPEEPQCEAYGSICVSACRSRWSAQRHVARIPTSSAQRITTDRYRRDPTCRRRPWDTLGSCHHSLRWARYSRQSASSTAVVRDDIRPVNRMESPPDRDRGHLRDRNTLPTCFRETGACRSVSCAQQCGPFASPTRTPTKPPQSCGRMASSSLSVVTTSVGSAWGRAGHTVERGDGDYPRTPLLPMRGCGKQRRHGATCSGRGSARRDARGLGD